MKKVKPAFEGADVWQCEEHKINGHRPCLVALLKKDEERVKAWAEAADAKHRALYDYAVGLERFVQGLRPVVPVIAYLPVYR